MHLLQVCYTMVRAKTMISEGDISDEELIKTIGDDYNAFLG